MIDWFTRTWTRITNWERRNRYRRDPLPKLTGVDEVSDFGRLYSSGEDVNRDKDPAP